MATFQITLLLRHALRLNWSVQAVLGEAGPSVNLFSRPSTSGEVHFEPYLPLALKGTYRYNDSSSKLPYRP